MASKAVAAATTQTQESGGVGRGGASAASSSVWEPTCLAGYRALSDHPIAPPSSTSSALLWRQDQPPCAVLLRRPPPPARHVPPHPLVQIPPLLPRVSSHRRWSRNGSSGAAPQRTALRASVPHRGTTSVSSSNLGADAAPVLTAALDDKEEEAGGGGGAWGGGKGV